MKQAHVLSAQRREELMLWHKNPIKYRPIKTGLFSFDRSGGIKFGTYVVVLGPDKAGKTAVAVKIALSLGSMMNCLLRIYALEESEGDWIDRMVSFMSTTIGRTRIMNLQLNAEDFDHWAQDLTPALQETWIEVESQVWKASDIIKNEIASIQAEMKEKGWKTIEEYKENGIPRIVMIDGFQLLGDFPEDKENDKLTKISRMLMEARSKWRITFVVIAQLNKAGRAYGSEAVYKDANLLLEIRRKKGMDGQPERGMAQMAVLPNRQSAPYPFMDFLLDGDHSRVANVGSVVLDDNGDTIEDLEPHPDDLREPHGPVVNHNFWK